MSLPISRRAYADMYGPTTGDRVRLTSPFDAKHTSSAMTTPTYSDPKQGVVQRLRSIRDQLSYEIRDMTFEQERAYLDQLLAEKPAASSQPYRAQSGLRAT